MQQSDKMARGGAFRTAAADVAVQDVIDSLMDYVKKTGMKRGAYFGAYEMIDRTHAAFAPGLASNSELLQVLLKLNPKGEYKPTVLTKAWQACCKLFVGLNSTGLPDDLWSGRRADICGTMLCHLRRVRHDGVKRSQLEHKASDADIGLIQDCLNMMEDCSKSAASSREGSPAETVLYATRKLKMQVSLDEHGFPKLLSESTCTTRSSSSKAEEIKALSAGDAHFHFFAELQAMSMASQAGKLRLAGTAVCPDEEPEVEEPAEAEVSPPVKRKSTKAVPETPVPKRRQSVESVKKTEAPGKKASSDAVDDEAKSGTCSMGFVRLIQATKQSYITAEKKLVVSITELMTEDHHEVARALFKQILQNKIKTKDAALAARKILLD